MKNKRIPITAILLLISIGNGVRITSHSQIRAVDFLSVLTIGVLIGILIMQIAVMLKEKKDAAGS
jgi:hypothetical protein